MANEFLYQPGARARTMPLPQSRGRGFGGETAEAIGAVGRAVSGAGEEQIRTRETVLDAEARAEQLLRERRQATERSKHMVRLAELEGGIRKDMLDLQTKAGPGAEGYAETVRTKVDEGGTAFMGEIADPELREEFAPRIAALGSRLTIDAETYAVAARADQAKTGYQTARDLWGNLVFTNPDADTLKRASEAMTALVDADTRLDGNTKEALHRDWRSLIARQALLGQKRDNPAAGLKMIREGVFNGWLDADETATIESTLQAELRRIENETEERANGARADMRERISLAKDRQANGEVLPDDELAALQEGAATLALPKEEYDIGAIRIRNNVNRQTEPWRPRQYEHRINELRAKPAAERTIDEAIELDQLEKIAPGRIAEFNRNPGGRAAALGNPPPALDWQDPATIRERLTWARGIQRDTGRPAPFLTPQEIKPIADLVEGNPGQRRQAAELLARFGDAEAIRGAAELVAPHDAAFKIAVRLSTLPDRQAAARRMRWALDGPQYLASNREVWDEAEARRVFSESALPALRRLGADYIEGVFTTAKNLYASRETQHGNTKWTEGAFRMAVQMAVGFVPERGARTGGIHGWGPGSGRGLVVVPVGMTEDEFEARIFGADQAGFTKGALDGKKPVHSDGRPVTVGEIKRYLPVAVREGVYAFWTGAGFVPAKQGGPWLLDVRRVPRRKAK